MGVGGTLRQLAGFLEECEQSGPVDDVELAECTDSADASGLTADIELTLSRSPLDEGAMTVCATSVNADGTMRFAFETPDAVLPTSGHDVDIEPRESTLEADGTVRVLLSASVAGDDPSADYGTTTTDEQPTDVVDPDPNDEVDATTSGSPNREVPPFKNPELLREVYESCDTFAAMADTLEMDVTAETVRRYMIDFDIHEPNSYDTGPGGDESESEPDPEPGDPTEFGDDEQTPVVLSDGIGLPEDVTVDTLIETVKESNTIYEVKQNIGVDRENALEMLRDLNLLDLVVGRLATEAERDIGREDVIRRLREASATQ